MGKIATIGEIQSALALPNPPSGWASNKCPTRSEVSQIWGSNVVWAGDSGYATNRLVELSMVAKGSDISTAITMIQTVGPSGFTGGVYPSSTADVQGVLNKLPGEGVHQGIKVKFTTTKTISMQANTFPKETYLIFQDSQALPIPIYSVNGSTTRQTLAMGVEHEVQGTSSALRDRLFAKTNPPGSGYLSATIKIIAEDVEIGSVRVRYRVVG